MIEIDAVNHQPTHPVDLIRLEESVKQVLVGEGFPSATIGIAVVDDPSIRRLNRRHLAHDHATDVLSFVASKKDGHLEGEVIISVDTAVAEAGRYDWAVADELLLYVVHGTLHLAGHDDRTLESQHRMRERERYYLAKYNLTPRYNDNPTHRRGEVRKGSITKGVAPEGESIR